MENNKNRSIFPCALSSEYEIELSDKSRRDEIVDMLIENFLHDETLVKSMRDMYGVKKHEGDKSSLEVRTTDCEEEEEKEEEEWSKVDKDERILMETVVDAGTVLTAVHKPTNRISGAIVVLVHDRNLVGKNSDDRYDGKLRSRTISEFANLMGIIDKSLDLFAAHPECRIWAEFELVGIRRADRRRGLGFDLCAAALNHVIKTMPEVDLVAGKYTSNYSKIIARKIGKINVADFDVTRLADREGHPVFQDTKPHNVVSLMTIKLR
ncbi:uncharacterized protein LOC124301338 [Neodiprion virginianus]|uniref:uncharacterized protein LOC124301338 n=1 Tax=Neodiprion virginianus TaxID=2961670 RepID=UPI001EE6EA4A|nr:uncharacterized protein LOC124301338 [Neodiprion virginianus]